MTKVLKRWIWGFVFLAAAAVGIATWRPVHTSAIDWYICNQCHALFGGQFTRRQITQQAGTWTIEAPAITHAIHVGGASFDAKAERIEFSYDFHPFSWELDLNVLIVNPEMTFAESNIDWMGLVMENHALTPLVKISPKVIVQNGTLNFSNPLHVDIDIDFRGKKRAEIKAGFDLYKDDVTLVLEKENRQIKVLAELNELDLSRAFSVVKQLTSSVEHMELDSGIVSGSGSALFAKGVEPSYGCEMHCQGLKCALPEQELFVDVEAMTLALDKQTKRWLLDLSESASVRLQKEGQDYWAITNLLGEVDITPSHQAQVTLNGFCTHDEKELLLRIEGGGFFADENQEALTVAFSLNDALGKGVKARLFARQLGGDCDCYEAEIHQFGPEEYALLQHLAKDFEWPAVYMGQGALDAELLAFVEKGHLTDVRLEKIQAKHVECYVAPLNMTLDVASLRGGVAVNFQDTNLFETLDADLSLEGGFIDVDGWKLTDMHTDLQIREGQLLNSLLKGSFAGMKGTIGIEEEKIAINFAGDVLGLASLGPEVFSKGIKEKFQQDHVVIAAEIDTSSPTLTVNGKITVEKDEIRVGFDLKKKPQDPWAFCSRPVGDQEALVGVPLINRELNIAGFWVQDGWFVASGLAMDKYVAPFFLDDMSLTGSADLEGTFDQSHISIQYDAKEFCLENKDFAIKIPRIAHHSEAPWATYEIDLEFGKNSGFIPAYQATYFEKNSGLLFNTISAELFINEKGVQIPKIEAFCNGLYFAGNILVETGVQNDGLFDLKIHTDTISGQLSCLQDLFGTLNKPLFFNKIPLEGSLNFREKGADLLFSFRPDGYEFQAHLEGALTDGVFRMDQKNLVVEEFGFNFAYDYLGNTLDFTDIQGTLLIGKPGRVEEYSVAADHIRFTDYKNSRAEFDLWVGDKKRDVIRLVGTTVPLDNERVSFQLDQEKSHFGAVHPTKLNLVMLNWGVVEHFDLEMEFKLETLFHDLQRLGRTGLLPVSRHFFDKLDGWKSGEGLIDFALHYDKADEVATYTLKGQDVSTEEFHFHDVQLKGAKKHDHWMVDLFKLDDWSFAADLTPREEEIGVNFLGAQYGESLLMGVKGIYDLNQKFFDGAINLLEVNLDQLKGWESVKIFADTYAPHGQLKASGKLTVDASDETVLVDAMLDTSLHSWGLKDLDFTDVRGVSCHLSSDRGITFRRIGTALKSEGAVLGKLDLERLDYRFSSQDITLEGLAFEIPSSYLTPFLQEIQRVFPEIVNDRLVGTAYGLKNRESFEGLLDFEMTGPHYGLSVALKDGLYEFMGQKHEIKNLSMEYDPCEFRITSQYIYQDTPYWLIATSHSPSLDTGELTVSLKRDDPSALTIQWSTHPVHGFFIERMFGPLPGLEFDLVRDTTRPLRADAFYLEGDLSLDGTKAAPWIAKESVETFKAWGFGKGYGLKGKWEVHLPPGELFFHGDLMGKNFVCKGYEVDLLSAKVDLSPNFVTVRNIEVTDPAGVLYADQFEMCLDEGGKWMVSMPQMQVTDFSPSLLREVGSNYAPIKKPLIVHRIEVNELKGELADASTLIGNGTLYFSNPPKKNLQNTLFAFPSEILSRIGLDLKVLNPVTGSVYYDIRDRKIFLSRFKDIFSEGKLSKFYLPNTDYKSYVDLDGNLHVQVKMKQYNLVFKLAELFTVTIQGSLTKPTYTLQKQQSRD